MPACSPPRWLSRCHAALGLGCCFWSCASAIIKFSSDWEVLHNLRMKPQGFSGVTLKPCWNLIKDRDWSLACFLKWSARFYDLNVILYSQNLAIWNCTYVVQFCSFSLKLSHSIGLLAKEFLLVILSDDTRCWANASAAVVWHALPLEVPRLESVGGTLSGSWRPWWKPWIVVARRISHCEELPDLSGLRPCLLFSKPVGVAMGSCQA